MQKLAVVDLDKTLINVDSSMYFIYKYRVLELLFWGILRKLGIVSRLKFSDQVEKKMKKLLTEYELDIFVKLIEKTVNSEIIQKIEELKKNNIKVIVVSASPDFFVKRFSAEFELDGFGSYRTPEGKYIHLYGKNKLECVLEIFPQSSFDYYFAVSDSISDKYLFDAFANSYLFRHNKLEKS